MNSLARHTLLGILAFTALWPANASAGFDRQAANHRFEQTAHQRAGHLGDMRVNGPISLQATPAAEYETATGIRRWLSADQLFLEQPKKCLESPGQCNLYSYAGNNPVAFTDPTGESAKDAIAGFSIGFFNGIGMMLSTLNARDCHDNPMARVEFRPQEGVWSGDSRDDAHFRGGVEAGKIFGTFATIFAAKPRRGGKLPQGITRGQWSEVSATLRQDLGHISGDIRAHGSRAAYRAGSTSDLDIAVRVSGEVFEQIVRERFGHVKRGTAIWRTMQHALDTGKITARRAGIAETRNAVQEQLGMKVDLSIVREGGKFDQGPWIPIGGGQ